MSTGPLPADLAVPAVPVVVVSAAAAASRNVAAAVALAVTVVVVTEELPEVMQVVVPEVQDVIL